jgi:hypothetical protein
MAASPEDIAKGVKMAEQEMDYRVDLYNRCCGLAPLLYGE